MAGLPPPPGSTNAVEHCDVKNFELYLTSEWLNWRRLFEIVLYDSETCVTDDVNSTRATSTVYAHIVTVRYGNSLNRLSNVDLVVIQNIWLQVTNSPCYCCYCLAVIIECSDAASRLHLYIFCTVYSYANAIQYLGADLWHFYAWRSISTDYGVLLVFLPRCM